MSEMARDYEEATKPEATYVVEDRWALKDVEDSLEDDGNENNISCKALTALATRPLKLIQDEFQSYAKSLVSQNRLDRIVINKFISFIIVLSNNLHRRSFHNDKVGNAFLSCLGNVNKTGANYYAHLILCVR